MFVRMRDPAKARMAPAGAAHGQDVPVGRVHCRRRTTQTWVLLSPLNKQVTNALRTATGKIRAVCQCCGSLSRAHAPNSYGDPDLCEMGRGWSEARFPADFLHEDGSTGSIYTCPACNALLLAERATKRVRSVQPVLDFDTWQDILRAQKERDHERIALGEISNRDLMVFGVFDMDRDISIDLKKMFGK